MTDDEATLRKRIIATLESGAKNTKNFNWMKEHLLTELDLKPTDLRNVLKIMWNDGTVGQTYGNYWIKHNAPSTPSNGDAIGKLYQHFPHNNADVITSDFILEMQKHPNVKQYIKDEFTEDDAYLFIGLACAVLDKPLPFALDPNYSSRKDEKIQMYAGKLEAFLMQDNGADQNEL